MVPRQRLLYLWRPRLQFIMFKDIQHACLGAAADDDDDDDDDGEVCLL